MWEYKKQVGSRYEVIKGALVKGLPGNSSAPNFRGPFDYVQYNYQLLNGYFAGFGLPGETAAGGNVFKPVLGVDRPASKDYAARGFAVHSTNGVEVELLNADQIIPGATDDGSPSTFTDSAGTFKNPTAVNRFMRANGDIPAQASVLPKDLRYRVRFRYPLDPLVKEEYGEAANTVDPKRHYSTGYPRSR